MKYVFIILLLSFSIISPAFGSIDKDCLNYNKSSQPDSKCIEITENLFKQGYSSYENGDYEEAVEYYNEARRYNKDNKALNYNLGLSFFTLGTVQFDEGNYQQALLSFKSAILVEYKDEILYYSMGLAQYYSDGNSFSQQVAEYFDTALELADTQDRRDEIESEIYYLKGLELSPTNDLFSWTQYYLHDMNIPEAWNTITENNQVIVAVIDDGINIHHPDLKNSLWVDINATYGESKVKDFVGDGIDNVSSGDHGTMVAGIIAAEINNNE